MHDLSLLRSSKTTPQLNFSLAISIVKWEHSRRLCFSVPSFEALILKGLFLCLFVCFPSIK